MHHLYVDACKLEHIAVTTLCVPASHVCPLTQITNIMLDVCMTVQLLCGKLNPRTKNIPNTQSGTVWVILALL